MRRSSLTTAPRGGSNKWRSADTVGRPESTDPQLVALKVPPHSVEAEQSLLGGLLLDNQAFDRIADLVTGEDFYRDDHRRIWRHIARLIEATRPADVVTVAESIEASEDKDKTGGLAYLAALAQNTPSALNIRRYAELVRERAVLRRLAQVATEIAESALAPSRQGSRASSSTRPSRRSSRSPSPARASDQGLLGIEPVLAKVFERIDHLYNQDNPSDVTGVPTGFTDLDQMTAGLQPGDLIIVAGAARRWARPRFALNIAEHVALHPSSGLPVAIFSMEMGASSSPCACSARSAASTSTSCAPGGSTTRTGRELTDAIGRLHEAPIFIDETPALNALELRARARRLKREYAKLGLIVVDYLQLMSATAQGENRATEISEISRSLKALAKELDVPVIALSQLNRARSSSAPTSGR